MSEDTKQLDELKADELREYAKTRGIEIPEAVTQKAALVHIIRTAEAPPEGTFAEVDDVDEQVKDLGNGYERVTRPVRAVEDNGDWRCPFTGLRVWHGQATVPEIRGVVQLPKARRRRVDDVGHPFVPVEVGDLVAVERLALEEVA